MDQVHSVQLDVSDVVDSVIKKPMTKTEIAEFRQALVKSYNPEGLVNGVQASDIKVEGDDKYLYFLMKTDRVDQDGKIVWRLIIKLHRNETPIHKPDPVAARSARPSDPRDPRAKPSAAPRR